jgi:flagellar biosynthetic protein FliR
VLSSVQVFQWVEQYYWPFLRLSALFLAAPVFSAASFPVRSRVLLAVLVTAVVAPALGQFSVASPLSGEGFLLAVSQVLIGVAMGFILQLVFAAAVVAGQALAMTMGLGFAMSVDPQNGLQVPVLSQFYVILATLLFLTVDGHLLLIHMLVQSFELIPAGMPLAAGELAFNVLQLGTGLFVSALLLALPALTAVLLINTAFGVITRAAPQLNIFAVGFPVTILAGFIFVFLSLPVTVTLLTDAIQAALQATIAVLP